MTQTGVWKTLAEFFGRLMLHELDEGRRAALTEPPVATALSDVGIDVAALAAADLDELAVEFFETFVQPKTGGPLVQSLWTHGAYEGDSAVAIRKLAEFTGAEFDRDAARGAPHDHLGSILVLWATVADDFPEVAARIEEQHLTWALEPLARIGAGEGFYASFATAAESFVRMIMKPE